MSLSNDRQRLLKRLVCGQTGPPSSNGGSTEANAARVRPASYAQRRLWFLDHLQQEDIPYTLYAAHPLCQQVDPRLLEEAVNEIVRRHEVLRTTLPSQNGAPVQCIAAQLHVPVRIVDLRQSPSEKRRTETTRLMEITIARRFDLERGPLIRTDLFRLNEQEWAFLVVVHHIIFDAPSFQVFFSELNAIYAALSSGRSPDLPARRVQYADFVASQQSALTPQRVASEVAFWLRELADLPLLDLPADRRRATVPAFRGAIRPIEVPPAIVSPLQLLAGRRNTTLFTVLLAAFAAALARICGQDDFAVGLPVTGRDSTDLQGAIGLFVDTLVVRCHLENNPSMDELIDRIRSAMNRSLAHRALPFEMLVEHLRPVRQFGVNPIFQVGFQLMQFPMVSTETQSFHIPQSSTIFDLGLDLWQSGDGLQGRIQYNTDLFDPPIIEVVAGAFQQALIAQSAGGQSLLDFPIRRGDAEACVSIIEGEKTGFDARSCGELIRRSSEAQAETIALEADGIRISYSELMERAARLAGVLRRRGVSSGSLVAMNLQRCAELIVLQLAAWHAGAAFVCIDPDWPEQRRRQALEEARPALTIDASELASLWDECSKATPLSAWPQASDPAYVIFTSGSTGRPKGVVLNHVGLLNVAAAQLELFGLGPGRRVAQLASSTFDASVFEIMLALCSGATLVVAEPNPLVADALAEFITRFEIDTLVLPPTLLSTVDPSSCPSLRLLCVAGESCPADLQERWKGRAEFWNLYGPTEATIWATYGREKFGNRVVIGRPIRNVTTIVVDSRLRPVPPGVVGELCLAGCGLARGYLQRADLTIERFIPNSAVPAGRMYRTGDLVRQLSSGKLLFLGRADRQVKVRGFRIELEEIESVLRQNPLVGGVIVTVKADPDGKPLLIAYIQCSHEANGLIEELRRLVREKLPHFMLPSHFVVLQQLPRTSSGKVDTNALPLPSELDRCDNGYVEPATKTERVVAELMARVARTSRAGARDDFFEIGGHSLAAAQLVAQLTSVFNVRLTIREVFVHSTVAALASRIDELAADRNTGCGSDDEEDIPLVRLPRAGGELAEERPGGIA